MNPRSPVVTLNNGVEMPALGLGVFLAPPDRTAGAVETALAAGYRLVDTAAAYGNERQVGEGIARSGIARSEIFVTTKLWMTDYGHRTTRRAFDTSLHKLGLDYVDLYLLHWPVPSSFDTTVAAYRVAEQLLADGLVRAIGVSNFSPSHLERLREQAETVPAVNQVELNPFFAQRDLRNVHARLGIVTQAWAPIGGVYGRNPSAAPDSAATPLEHPTIVRIAEEHGRTPAQIVLRWHLQLGIAAIPKSVRPERIAENFDVFDFTLTDNELDSISSLDTGTRAGADPDRVDATTFGIVIDPA